MTRLDELCIPRARPALSPVQERYVCHIAHLRPGSVVPYMWFDRDGRMQIHTKEVKTIDPESRRLECTDESVFGYGPDGFWRLVNEDMNNGSKNSVHATLDMYAFEASVFPAEPEPRAVIDVTAEVRSFIHGVPLKIEERVVEREEIYTSVQAGTGSYNKSWGIIN